MNDDADNINEETLISKASQGAISPFESTYTGIQNSIFFNEWLEEYEKSIEKEENFILD